jgi:hypothetical protein
MRRRLRLLIPPLLVASALGLGACDDGNDNPEIGEQFQEEGEQIGEEFENEGG